MFSRQKMQEFLPGKSRKMQHKAPSEKHAKNNNATTAKKCKMARNANKMRLHIYPPSWSWFPNPDKSAKSIRSRIRTTLPLACHGGERQYSHFSNVSDRWVSRNHRKMSPCPWAFWKVHVSEASGRKREREERGAPNETNKKDRDNLRSNNYHGKVTAGS